MRTLTFSPVQAMSMRGPSAEENHTAGLAETCDRHKNEDEPAPHPMEATSLGETLVVEGRGVCSQPSASLIALMACRELSPRILEHEKALLVIKEHDYARAPDRPRLLQLSSMYARAGEEDAREPAFSAAAAADQDKRRGQGVDLTPASVEEVLLNCRSDVLCLRASLARKKDESVVATHLRDVVGLQVALIRKQQEQLYEKDKEMGAIRKEKEQLEARLERMERRLAVLQKHSKGRHSINETDHTSSTPLHPRPSHLAARFDSEHRSHSRSSSVDCGRSRSRPSSHSGTPTPDDYDISHSNSSSAKRAAKRRLRGELDQVRDVKKARRKSLQVNEVRTSLEFTGLNLPSLNGSSNSLDKECNHAEMKNKLVENNRIVVPSWCVCEVQSSETEEAIEVEDTSDEVFGKRHKKPEEDEKRRKRWDLQRLRQQKEHEDLLKKYQQKSGTQPVQKEKKKEKIVTFLPQLEDIEVIEVLNTVAVGAFGRPLPLIPSSEFELPWFDLDVREARETVRTTRSKARATRIPLGSSDEL